MQFIITVTKPLLRITVRFVQVWRKEAQSAAVRYWALVRAKVFQPACRQAGLDFCSYLYHRFFNWAAVPGRRFSNSPTTPIPTVSGNFTSKLQ